MAVLPQPAGRHEDGVGREGEEGEAHEGGGAWGGGGLEAAWGAGCKHSIQPQRLRTLDSVMACTSSGCATALTGCAEVAR